MHTAITKQKILVLDVNDNSPEFSQQFYQVSLPENTPAGTSITHVSATDKDAGDNGKVRYTIENVSPKVLDFWIDPKTGEILYECPVLIYPSIFHQFKHEFYIPAFMVMLLVTYALVRLFYNRCYTNTIIYIYISHVFRLLYDAFLYYLYNEF